MATEGKYGRGIDDIGGAIHYLLHTDKSIPSVERGLIADTIETLTNVQDRLIVLNFRSKGKK